MKNNPKIHKSYSNLNFFIIKCQNFYQISFQSKYAVCKSWRRKLKSLKALKIWTHFTSNVKNFLKHHSKVRAEEFFKNNQLEFSSIASTLLGASSRIMWTIIKNDLEKNCKILNLITFHLSKEQKVFYKIFWLILLKPARPISTSPLEAEKRPQWRPRSFLIWKGSYLQLC